MVSINPMNNSSFYLRQNVAQKVKIQDNAPKFNAETKCDEFAFSSEKANVLVQEETPDDEPTYDAFWDPVLKKVAEWAVETLVIELLDRWLSSEDEDVEDKKNDNPPDESNNEPNNDSNNKDNK